MNNNPIKKPNVTIEFLVDSGAARSLLRTDDFAKLELPDNQVVKCDHNFIAANNSRLFISHKVTLDLTIGGKSVEHQFFVSPKITHNILGWDIITKYDIILANGEFFVDSEASKKLYKLSRHNNVISKRNYTIAPGESVRILGHLRKDKNAPENGPVLIDDFIDKNKKGGGQPLCQEFIMSKNSVT